MESVIIVRSIIGRKGPDKAFIYDSAVLTGSDDDEDEDEDEDEDNNEYVRDDFMVDGGAGEEEDEASMPLGRKNDDLDDSDEDDDEDDDDESKGRKRTEKNSRV